MSTKLENTNAFITCVIVYNYITCQIASASETTLSLDKHVRKAKNKLVNGSGDAHRRYRK